MNPRPNLPLVLTVPVSALLLVSPAVAQDTDGTKPKSAPSILDAEPLPAPITEPEPAPSQTVEVTADPFARWDGTRWRLDSAVVLPLSVPMFAVNNFEIETVGFVVRLTTRCELADRAGPRRRVNCTIQDAAVSLAPRQRTAKKAIAVVEEHRERMVGTVVRLQVHQDGRISSLTLGDEVTSPPRARMQFESVRQILWTAFAAFDLQLPDGPLTDGRKFVEESSRLWWIPSFRNNDQLRSMFSASAIGRGQIGHIIEARDVGHVIVGVGEGSVDLGLNDPMVWQGPVNSVSLIAKHDAILAERVWGANLEPNASNRLGDGVTPSPTVLQGRLQRLGDDQTVDLGASQMVNAPGLSVPGLPGWPGLM